MMGSIFSPRWADFDNQLFFLVTLLDVRSAVAPPHPSTPSLPSLLKIWGYDAAQNNEHNIVSGLEGSSIVATK
jgi:hypothetical protein